jgi:SAM-dependent methyltransferase
MDPHVKANRDLWNEWTPIHEKSELYDLAGFRAGQSSLKPLELEEVGDVAGKSLLHLQCHFGKDTLSWARQGARVTGADFSDRAIALARSLSRDLGIEADFVCSDIYELPGVLSGQFDIVFTSYGVLCWLSDLRRWAAVIAHFLKPGGTFYIAEFHPFAQIFYNEPDAVELKVAYPYFHQAEPFVFEAANSYADASVPVASSSHEWSHSMGDILNSLIGAGLRVDFLHEFAYCTYAHFPFMQEGPDGRWRLKGYEESVPLMFSLKATKCA